MVKTQKFDNLKVCLQKFLKKMQDQINAQRQWAINQKQRNFSQISKQSLELLNRKIWQTNCVEIYCNQSSICWNLCHLVTPKCLKVFASLNVSTLVNIAQNQQNHHYLSMMTTKKQKHFFVFLVFNSIYKVDNLYL
jgi:hypothetical protein